ncbi:hypothetical protein ACEWY4_025919 [Coilia grayii]|uniref:Ferlin C-terminal domain-containing protein n=1 Tax=Coilia grayii TaxID=363190 RepID=A0ABD1IUB1_9TELE
MPHKCSIDMLSKEGDIPHQKWDETKSLFNQKAVRGWWPCVVENGSQKELGGKVELSLEIVAEQEADERPDKKNLNPHDNLYVTMKFIVWRRFKWLFIGLIILILVLLFIGILLYSLPFKQETEVGFFPAFVPCYVNFYESSPDCLTPTMTSTLESPMTM